MNDNDIDEIVKGIYLKEPRAIGRAISIIEDGDQRADALLKQINARSIQESRILGITGPIGTGKSTIINQLIAYYRKQGCRVGIVAIDPSSPVSGGAFLGDRIRMMRHAMDKDVVVRSMATRGKQGGLCAAATAAVRIMICSGCNPVIIETSGVGQTEIDVVRLADITVLVLAPGAGDEIQAMKAGIIEIADIVVVNKAECPGADSLIMELENVLHQRSCPVCRVIAKEAYGIENLAASIEMIDNERRKSGQFTNKRKQTRETEIIDCAIEMMRDELRSRLKECPENYTGDPRTIARKLIDDICISGSYMPKRNHSEVFS
ncbi:methylmalonyl Co-A mutase-associated GTPase MeaB [Candidatus Kuenenia sp.]|uniref:methylmalonyl Co-A mutase-associated GTPase MeaB n=1 Tax=Candidatus Kuenenia sp. TaxID=2499824 RepID=UPI00321FE11B